MKKKNKRAVSSIIFSLLICIAFFVLVTVLNLKPVGYDYTDKLLDAINSKDHGISVSFGSVDRQMFNKIQIQGISLSGPDGEFGYLDSVDISVGLFQLAKAFVGFDVPVVKIYAHSVNLNLNDRLLDFLSKDNKDAGRNSGNEDSTFLENLDLLLSVDDINFNVDFKGYSLTAMSAQLSAGFKKGLKPSNFSFRFPNITGFIPQTDETLYVTELRADSDKNGKVEFIVDRIFASESIDVRTVKASASFDTFFKISGSVDFESIEVHLDDFKADSFNISSVFAVDLKSKKYSFDFKVPDVVYLSEDIDSKVSGLRAKAVLKDNEDWDLDVKADDLKFKIKEFEAQLNSVSFVGNSIENLEFNIGNFVTTYVSGQNCLSGNFKYNKELSAKVVLQNSLTADIEYFFENKNFSLDVDADEVALTRYSDLIKKFSAFVSGYVDSSTLLSGSISSEGCLTDRGFDFYSLVAGLNFDNIKIGKDFVNLSTYLRGSYVDSIAQIPHLFVEGLDKRLTWQGTFNTKTLMPEGQLNISDLKTRESIVSVDFDYDSALKKYNFKAVTDLVSDLEFKGNIDFSSNPVIRADSVLKTIYKDYPLEIVFNRNTKEVSASSPSLELTSRILQDNYWATSGSLKGFSVVLSKDLEVKVNNGFSGIFDLHNNTYTISIFENSVEVSDIMNVDFNLRISNGFVELSEISVGRMDQFFDFDGLLSVSGIDIGKVLSGESSIVAKANLSRKDTDEYVKFDIVQSDVWADISLNLPLAFKLSLLGNFKDDFYFEGRVGNLDFDSKYSDKKLTIDSSSGGFGSLSISNFAMNVDFDKKTLESGFRVCNTSEMRTGTEKQGADVFVKAQLDSIRATALNIAGIDADADFTINLTDVYLSDGITIPDNSFVLSVKGNSYRVSGDLVNGYYYPESGEFSFSLDPKTRVAGFDAKGVIKNDIDVFVDNVFINLPVINQFLNSPEYTALNGSIEGSVLVKGPLKDPSLFGDFYASNIDLEIFYAPEQILSVKNASINIYDHCITMPSTKIFGYSFHDARRYTGNLSLDMDLVGMSVGSFDLHLVLDNKPGDVWFPTLGTPDIMIRADVLGDVHFKNTGGSFGIYGDVNVSDGYVSFVIPRMPDWFYGEIILCTLDLNVTFGKNVEFCYPDTTDYFVNFTIAEGEKLHYSYDMPSDKSTAEGSMGVKNGTIYYFQNDFYVTGGEARISKNKFSGNVELSFDLNAKLKEYDVDGKAVDIFLDLNNATFDNLAPRLSSSNGLSENEIIQILGKSFVPSKDQGLSVSSLASLAFTATDTISRLGIIESNNSYSLTSTIRDALDLDIFSFRSPVVQNMILDVLPGRKPDDVSLLSKYMNGTTLFLGKYITKNVFFKTSVLLKSAPNGFGSNEVGHFMANDLNLNLEISAEWDNPMGVMTLFTQPSELSVFNFLDNIGFSFSKIIEL